MAHSQRRSVLRMSRQPRDRFSIDQISMDRVSIDWLNTSVSNHTFLITVVVNLENAISLCGLTVMSNELLDRNAVQCCEFISSFHEENRVEKMTRCHDMRAQYDTREKYESNSIDWGVSGEVGKASASFNALNTETPSSFSLLCVFCGIYNIFRARDPEY